ncbi:hypothetical protein [Kitasatospora sp. MAP5-34]|uniref:hypothetical protein n=1 Tax=Kitasatospora sp. MAP5-34 TaxID=3035102 RepID=UPI002476F293|nr:hypothetical protein [Kitasatospora sp. MAP5-34]MDH6576624.1 VCBS repeat-containing protein [Kitasatospora sp. MAP5-34]
MIRQVDLVGDWGNAAGARMHVAADHSLTASGIKHAVPDYTCSTSLTAGSWQFDAQNGSPQDSTASATAGDSFTVWANDGKFDLAGCNIEALVQRDDRGFNICLVRDPDQTCTDKELLRKASTPLR